MNHTFNKCNSNNLKANTANASRHPVDTQKSPGWWKEACRLPCNFCWRCCQWTHLPQLQSTHPSFLRTSSEDRGLFCSICIFFYSVIFQVCIKILFLGIEFDEMGTLLFVFVFVCVFCNWCLFVASVFAAGAGASCRVCTGLTRWPTVTLFWFFTMTLSVLFCNILLHFQPQWWLLRSEPHGVSFVLTIGSCLTAYPLALPSGLGTTV